MKNDSSKNVGSEKQIDQKEFVSAKILLKDVIDRASQVTAIERVKTSTAEP